MAILNNTCITRSMITPKARYKTLYWWVIRTANGKMCINIALLLCCVALHLSFSVYCTEILIKIYEKDGYVSLRQPQHESFT